MTKRLYLCGGMSGLPDLNFPAFNAEAQRLRTLGYTVVNPAELNEPGTPWATCMRTDIRMLLLCDAIAMLPGWERSRGANLEWLIATELGMPVLQADMIDAAGDDEALLPTGASVALRVRHWQNTATGLMMASEESREEVARAHQAAVKFLRMAVEAGGCAMRAIYASDVDAEMVFAREAAAHFAKYPNCATYTSGDIEPGCFLAIRWGLSEDCVVVVKLDDAHVPTNYMELVRAAQTGGAA